MNISQKGADFIASFEKEVLHVYDDGFHYPTLGIGHLLTPAELKQFPMGTPITKEQSRAFWLADLQKYVGAVNAAVKVSVTQNQFDACCSLCFNIGISGFDHSSVLTFLNEGRIQDAADAFKRWNKAKGQVVKGLVTRRAAEREMFLTPDISAADTASSLDAPTGEAGTPSTSADAQPPIHLEGEGE